MYVCFNRDVFIFKSMKYFISVEYLTYKETQCIAFRIVCVALVILFIVNPIIGTLCTLFLSFATQDKHFAVLDVILLSLLMWLIQSTRSFHMNEPSDWAFNYVINFSLIENLSFIQYILFSGKEIAWQIENYIGYLIWGKFLPFGNFIVALTYFFTFLSSYIYWKSTKRSIRTLVASLMLFAFISEVSGISNNLLRQQFAMSMMLYVLVCKAVHNKVNWFLMLVALFTHSMTVLFIPFLFINIALRPSRKMIFLILIGLISFGLLMKIAQSFSGIYILARLASASDYRGSDVMDTAAVYPFLVVSIILYLKIIVKDKCIFPATLFICNIFLLLVFLCLAFQNMPLVQVRYFITRFFFLPLVVPYFFRQKEFCNNIYLVSVCIFFLYRYIQTGSYWLAPFDELFTRTIFQFSLV